MWNWSAITSVITAITALGALVFTGLSLSATREQIALTEHGQITDRYGKAVELIGRQGPEFLQIRLGGIYALERLGHDSPRDQPTIVEVLSAFIRISTKPAIGKSCSRETPNADVQAALTVLNRRNLNQDDNISIDLRNACLAFADLQGARLAGADLSHADLFNAYLTEAQLSGAQLYFANLDKAQLPEADLSNAGLDDANLNETNLGGAHLDHAYLRRAHLKGADLTAAYLVNAILDDADLTNAQMYGAQLDNAILTKSNLSGTRLNNANLSGTRLYNANLKGADLSGAAHDARSQTNGAQTDDKTLGKWW